MLFDYEKQNWDRVQPLLTDNDQPTRNNCFYAKKKFSISYSEKSQNLTVDFKRILLPIDYDSWETGLATGFSRL